MTYLESDASQVWIAPPQVNGVAGLEWESREKTEARRQHLRVDQGGGTTTDQLQMEALRTGNTLDILYARGVETLFEVSLFMVPIGMAVQKIHKNILVQRAANLVVLLATAC